MTALTRCPIDGSRIYRNHDGDIECSVALIGNHSKAVMLRWLQEHSRPVEAPSSAKGLGEPCSGCGRPKTAVAKAGWAYCDPCRRRGGKPANMAPFTVQGPPPQMYYFDSGRMMR